MKTIKNDPHPKKPLEEIKKYIKKKLPYIKLLQQYYRHILPGQKIFQRLVDQYGPDCRIYINHYPGTGDVFLTSSLLPAWAEKNGVKDYVVTVIGKSAYKVVQMFPIAKAEILTKRETEDLLHYLQTVGETNPNIEVLHFTPFAFQNTIMDRLLGVNGNHFMQMYLNVTFPGLTQADMLIPEEQIAEEEIDRIFEEHGLIPGRTVLLVPYANTIDPLSAQFWNYLADGLIRLGYTVCTNCDYPKEEKVRGTTPLFLRYNQLNQFVKKAGVIIQLRSGLTDLLYNCECNNFVLYPIENYYHFGFDTLYEYFSLKKMGLSSSAIELEFSRKDEKDICVRITDDLRSIPGP